MWEKVNENEYSPEALAPVQGHLFMKTSPIIDVILEPGDAIWVPCYHPHQAISQEKKECQSALLVLEIK